MAAVMLNTFVLFFLSFLVSHVTSLGDTDTITWGGDNSRTGYQTNHNMDPNIVGSAQFGQIFKAPLPGNYNGVAEQLFAQPLVYTTADDQQYLYIATTQNNIYKLNSATGAIVAQRNLHIPFQVADLDGCVDINPMVGVTATGVIDPDTDTWYLTSKTYENQTGGTGAQGLLNGRYYFHAINVNDMSEREAFPVPLEGTVATNNPVRIFGGGIHHQRPALLQAGQYIYAGFASHCVHDNFTGWIMGWDKDTGALVEKFATEGLGVDDQTKGGGVWMSGGGISSDNAGSMFFATGNGYASQLSTIPVNGRDPPTSLEEAAVHMTINSNGSLTIVDFFMPWEKTQLDGADKDLGTSPLEILPSDVFSCGDIQRIGVVTGKSGKTYWLNLDDLGGYQNGPNKLDDVIQVYQNENSVYAGAGVFPMDGGYIYINVIQYPTHVFQFSCNAGVPSFTKVADSPQNNAYLGVGHGTTTSLNGQAGSGLFWVSDVNGYNLRIYNAVPLNGALTLINYFNIPGVTKFTRPVFGNGRVYIGTTEGFLYGFGAPVNLPLNCSSPYDFGTANINEQTAARTVTCTALIDVTVSNITLTGNLDFSVSGLPDVPLNVAAGNTFSFQAAFKPTTVGSLSSDVVIATTNGVTGYSITSPVTFQGEGQSVAALLSINPLTVSFAGVITGNQIGGSNQTALFINQGNTPLMITDIQYSLQSETGPFVPTNTSASGMPQAGPFTFYGLPSTIPANGNAAVTINFDTPVSGNFAAYLAVTSTGGSALLDVFGTSGDPPLALVEFQTPDGLDWVQYDHANPSNFTFGNVTENQTRSLKLRVTNNASPDSARLSLTISKLPFGSGGIIGANNLIDLAEGTTLAPGEGANATLYCSAPKTQYNTDSYIGYAHWEVNFNDLTFGHQNVQFVCTAVAQQAPPLKSDGDGRYRYVGCFKENNPGRQLEQQLYGNDNNTNQMCIAACAAGNYIFCGTEYNRECWAGPTIPNLQVDDANCDFPCMGDNNQICGGNGVGSNQGGAYISLFADSAQWDGNTTSPTNPTNPTPGGPYVNPGVLGYGSIGCYTESTTGRALPNGGTMTNRTVASCISTCAASSYKYAGLEYGQECWCGNAFSAGSVPAPIGDCSLPCKDNTTEYCGAGSRLNVYQFGVAASSSSGSSTQISISTSLSSSSASVITTSSTLVSANSSSSTLSSSSSLVTGSNSSISDRSSLSTSSSTDLSSSSTQSSTSFSPSSSESSSSTTDTSLSTISSSTGTLASTSLSSSNSSTPTSRSSALSSSLSVISSTSTSSTSSAAPTQTIPAIKPFVGLWEFQGCWTESTTGRALSSTTYAQDNMTLESCADFCRGFTMFGTEYGRECYCGNALQAGSVKADNQADCLIKDFLCPGNQLEYCGGSSRLELYSIGTGSSTALASAVSSPSSLASSSVVSITQSTSLILSISSSAFISSSTTALSSSSTVASSSSSSSSSSTVVSRTSTLPPAPPVYTGPPVASTGNANFSYYNCVSEPSSGRLFSSIIENNGTAMTIEKCLTDCYMYTYAGVEYGRECWCGNTLNLVGDTGAVPGANVSDSQCSFTCPGNSSEFCGAGGTMSLYWFDSKKAAFNNGQVLVH